MMKKDPVLNMQHFESGFQSKDFYCNSIENHLVSGHKNIHKPHRHNFYLTVLFTHGSGVHEIDFVTYEVKPGSLFFLNPGQMHHWILSADVSGFIFFHTQSFYDLHFTQNRINGFPFFYSVQNAPVLYVEATKLSYFTSLFEQIHVENASEYVLKSQKIKGLVDLIYIESTRLYIGNADLNGNRQHPYSGKFQELQQLVEQYYKEQKSPSWYADKLHISAKHLNRIAQGMVAKTTTDIILDRVFLEAKRELILRKFSFNAIADDLGYDDYAYFSRLFKKKCGKTPSDFVNRYR